MNNNYIAILKVLDDLEKDDFLKSIETQIKDKIIKNMIDNFNPEIEVNNNVKMTIIKPTKNNNLDDYFDNEICRKCGNKDRRCVCVA